MTDKANQSVENLVKIRGIEAKVSELHATNDYTDCGLNHHEKIHLQGLIEKVRKHTEKAVAEHWPGT